MYPLRGQTYGHHLAAPNPSINMFFHIPGHYQVNFTLHHRIESYQPAAGMNQTFHYSMGPGYTQGQQFNQRQLGQPPPNYMAQVSDYSSVGLSSSYEFNDSYPARSVTSGVASDSWSYNSPQFPYGGPLASSTPSRSPTVSSSGVGQMTPPKSSQGCFTGIKKCNIV